MHLETFGRADAHTLLLCHGTGAPPSSLRALADSLAESYHVILPHFPGYEQSRAHATQSFEQHMSALVAQLAELGVERFTAIGHSFGFYRAQRLLKLCPQRLVQLIGLGGLASLPDEARAGYADFERLLRRGEQVPQGLMAGSFTPEYIDAHPALLAEVTSWWQECDLDTVCEELYVPIDQGMHNQLLAEAHIPVLLIHGKQDVTVPIEMARHLDTLGEHIELVELERCAHMAHMEHPARVLELIHNRLAR